jgi:hypothetical protein
MRIARLMEFTSHEAGITLLIGPTDRIVGLSLLVSICPYQNNTRHRRFSPFSGGLGWRVGSLISTQNVLKYVSTSNYLCWGLAQ